MGTKKNILFLLESKRGQSVSGEYIAGQLDISRNAVWKAIKELEKAGHKIKAVTGRGYMLCENNDILSAEGMLSFLSDKQSADKINIYSSLETTNKTAKEMAVAGAAHGTAVLADSQTAGRGRYGRKFHSPPGTGIYISFVLRPEHLRIETPTLITAFAAVAVCEAIEAVSDKKPRIKWVNDIFLSGKKICGISTEAVTDFESGSMGWVVLGIGVNFSTPEADFPEELRGIAGSVFPDGDPPITRNRLPAEIINRITAPQNQIPQKEMLEKYKSRLFMLGKRVLITGAKESCEAIATGIDDIGRLIVKKDTGEILLLSAGEISTKCCQP